jgi:hypothetical protein
LPEADASKYAQTTIFPMEKTVVIALLISIKKQQILIKRLS